MKQSFILTAAVLAALFFCSVTRDDRRANKTVIQTFQTRPNDGDSTLCKLLDSLPEPTAEEVETPNVVLSIRRMSVPVKVYQAIRNHTGHERFLAIDRYARYRPLLPFESGEKKLADLIVALAAEANNLNRKDFDWPAEGPNAPHQNRILYVYGGKDYLIREPTKIHKADNCSLLLHGLDCSGFVRQLFVKQGINFSEERADVIRTVPFLKKNLKNDYFHNQLFDVHDIGDSNLNPISLYTAG